MANLSNIPLIKPEVLDFWIDKNLNVLFVGKAGVGKTALIKSAFERKGLRARYFSASTMDPWVDFIGVPRMIEEGDKKYLELVRPKEFAEDEVEGLFFDEFNRASKKVRNAVMELMQFKSINGRKFNNLRIVWAAINPHDDEGTYDVEQIDPAQQDRFQVQFEIPYRPCPVFFRSKYGDDTAKSALEWWHGLSAEIKDKVSPRRLEYTIDMYLAGGDVKHILPNEANSQSLLNLLKNGSISDRMQKYFKEKDVEGARTFISIENNYAASIKDITKSAELRRFYVPLLSPEKITTLLGDNNVLDYVCVESSNVDVFKTVLKNIYNTKGKNSKAIMGKLRSVNAVVADEIMNVKGATAVVMSPNNVIADVVDYIENQCYNTYNRIATMKQYISQVKGGKNLTHDEAKYAVRAIEAFARHSHGNTIASHKEITDFINVVFDALAKYESMPLGVALANKYPCPDLYRKMNQYPNLKSAVKLDRSKP